jgi:hypothetical protein
VRPRPRAGPYYYCYDYVSVEGPSSDARVLAPTTSIRQRVDEALKGIGGVQTRDDGLLDEQVIGGRLYCMITGAGHRGPWGPHLRPGQ